VEGDTDRAVQMMDGRRGLLPVEVYAVKVLLLKLVTYMSPFGAELLGHERESELLAAHRTSLVPASKANGECQRLEHLGSP
jgi:hypothetical protein